MNIRFFPYDFDYRVKEGKVYVYLYGKMDDNGKICVVHEHRPFFYADIKDLDPSLLSGRLSALSLDAKPEPARVLSWEIAEKELLGKKRTFWKIYTNYPKAVPLIAKELQSWGAECYEKDILFIHRYLRDLGITPMTLLEASGAFAPDVQLRVPVFKADTVRQFSQESMPSAKILALDIETYALKKEVNYQKNPILMLGLYGVDEHGKETKKVITWKHFTHNLEYVEIVSDEAALLEQFRRFMMDYQPDIVTGYYSDGFDFPYIKARADKFGISLDIGADRSELEAETSRTADSRGIKARIKGTLHLDMLQFIRNIFGKNLKTDSFSLDSVSEELLGHKKHVVDLNQLGPTWDRNPDNLVQYCEYNLHDCRLTLQLCQKLLYDIMEFTKLVGLPPFDVIRMRFSKLVESYILKRGVEYNILAPNKPAHEEIDQRMEETYEGGFVYEPTPGIYTDLMVFDFRSLYPTIITAHNIGPESLNCSCCRDLPHVPGKEEYWFCQKEKKFLPLVLEELILRRADLKRLIKETRQQGENTSLLEARSYAIKILANSFYGYLGFFGARWYSIESARSVTAYARNYITQTITKAQSREFSVVYGDTDSMFITLGNKVRHQALEFMNEVNFDLPGHMELELEGFYPRGIFVALKGSEKGAKKKYALISESGKLKIVGFETVRRNWSPIAKEIQEEVLRLILSGKEKEALPYVRDLARKVRQGEIPNDQFIIKTQITRELDRYASIGPHVAIARRLAERGESINPGMLVEYIIGTGPGLVRERAVLPDELEEGKYDAEYYINNQIMPAVSSIFSVLGYSEDDVFKESSQMGLGKFFS